MTDFVARPLADGSFEIEDPLEEGEVLTTVPPELTAADFLQILSVGLGFDVSVEDE